jgi:hypothetical protein
MVVLVVATTKDPASIGPAAAFLAMPGWSPGPPIAVSRPSSSTPPPPLPPDGECSPSIDLI